MSNIYNKKPFKYPYVVDYVMSHPYLYRSIKNNMKLEATSRQLNAQFLRRVSANGIDEEAKRRAECCIEFLEGRIDVVPLSLTLRTTLSLTLRTK